MPEADRTMIARQPFTFGGVARFSSAGIGRLLFVALLFGIVSGSVVSWLATTCFAPVVDEAIAKLPPTGSIERGALHWPENSGRLLAANAFLSFGVSLQNSQSQSGPVDFAVEVRASELAVTSVFGTFTVRFPAGLEIEINRTALSPAWGAWRAPLLFALIPGTALALILSWGVLAIGYSIVPILIGAVFNRQMGFRRAWKLSMAAQLPSSLMMAFALALYSSGKISLLFVMAMLVAHFVPTAAFLLISPFFAPRAERIASEANPFEGGPRRKAKGKNPFAGK